MRQQHDTDSTLLDLNRTVGIIKVQNFIFLAFAYCTWTVYADDQCQDPHKETFLHWVYYGNLIIFIVILLGMISTKIPSIYSFLNRCGAVAVTLQTCLFQGSMIIFHFFFMVYSIQQHFWSDTTPCTELELFIMVYAYVSIVWIFLPVYQCVLRIIIKAVSNQTDYALDNQSGR